MSYLSAEQRSQVRGLVLFTAIATTLIVWTSLADPINLPKMFVLTILSAWVLGLVASALIYGRGTNLPVGLWAVFVFALGLLVAALLTDVKYTAFFGALQRNDGALSYLALATLCIAAMMSFGPTDVKQVRTVLLVVGSVLTGYGFLQSIGNDPFNWVLVYGPMIGTLGNPNFLSGLLGASSIATLWVIIAKEKVWFRGAGIILLLLELFIIKRTGSIQGFAAFGVGFTFLAIVKLWHINKRVGVISLFFAGLGSIPVLMGLLNKGPLAGEIYQTTLMNRLDYWRAAINMFKAHPFTGVGLDRLGENYRQYVPQVQVVQAQTTDNVHNVFLQLLATGGLVVVLPYLFLLGVILWTGLRGIKASKGEAQIDIVAIFSIWFVLLLVSSVSIDNLGVAVWFWISGGVLYGVAHQSLRKDEHKPIGKQKSGKSAKRVTSNNASLVAPIASLVVTIVALVIMVPAWRSSAMVMDLQRNTGGLTQPQFVEKIKQVAKIQPNNVQTLIVLSDMALRISQVDLALGYTKSINEKDPRSYYGNYLSATAHELRKQYIQAIPYRVRLVELGPWDTVNMLGLVKDYLQVKELDKARAIVARISALRPDGDDAKAATALLNG